jgi:protoporphyrinogen oxidase
MDEVVKDTRSVAIIGAGPAGLTAAYELSKRGITVNVFEALACVGGLCRTISLWDQKVDLGPHRFFSSDPRVNSLWLEVVGRDYAMVDRSTRILYKNRFFDYPLKPLAALKTLGLKEAASCLSSYFQQQVFPDPGSGTFENWVVHRFGRRLYEIFFKNYSEKLWGIPCNELDADFAAQRIKKLSLLEAIKNAVSDQGHSSKHRTLVDRFAYPLGGTGMVYKRMAAAIESRGGKVHLRTPVRRLGVKNGRVSCVELEGGREIPTDAVVSTMPLTLLVKNLPHVPAAVIDAVSSLRFRNTILVYLLVDSADLFRDNWIYVHSPELKVGRITNFRNWVPQLHGSARSTILALEFWCNDDDALWSAEDSTLIRLAKHEIRATGLIGNAAVQEGNVHRIRRCYPVYRVGYKSAVGTIAKYLSSIDGLMAIGRYGSFKYNNQDHSMLMGLLCAQNVLHGRIHDLWGVNTDYEAYQEATVITGTGLEPAPTR